MSYFFDYAQNILLFIQEKFVETFYGFIQHVSLCQKQSNLLLFFQKVMLC